MLGKSACVSSTDPGFYGTRVVALLWLLSRWICLAEREAFENQCRLSVLQSKSDFSCARGLSALQSKHVELFTAAYPDCCRPKHHFPSQERQIEKTQCHIDCFPMERKNKYFKRLAPQIQRLTGFSTSCLLRLVEKDLGRWRELDWTDKLVQPKSM